MLTLTPQVTDELADSFSKLGTAKAPTPVSDSKMVVVNPDQKVDTPMEIMQTTEASQGTEAYPKTLSVPGGAALNYHEINMLPEVVGNLQLDTRGVKDLLCKEDMHKYEGDEKFNPKSFRSGSSVGHINLLDVTHEVLFAQIGILRELMFDMIPLSRYNHLVRN